MYEKTDDNIVNFNLKIKDKNEIYKMCPFYLE